MPERRDIRPGVAIGVAIVCGMIATKSVEKALAPQFGEWGAWGLGVAVGMLVAAIIGLIVYRLIQAPK